jgi:hypothetical protein
MMYMEREREREYCKEQGRPQHSNLMAKTEFPPELVMSGLEDAAGYCPNQVQNSYCGRHPDLPRERPVQREVLVVGT